VQWGGSASCYVYKCARRHAGATITQNNRTADGANVSAVLAAASQDGVAAKKNLTDAYGTAAGRCRSERTPIASAFTHRVAEKGRVDLLTLSKPIHGLTVGQ
jgi:hypothetical protein